MPWKSRLSFLLLGVALFLHLSPATLTQILWGYKGLHRANGSQPGFHTQVRRGLNLIILLPLMFLEAITCVEHSSCTDHGGCLFTDAMRTWWLNSRWMPWAFLGRPCHHQNVEPIMCTLWWLFTLHTHSKSCPSQDSNWPLDGQDWLSHLPPNEPVLWFSFFPWGMHSLEVGYLLHETFFILIWGDVCWC